jgi:hypothetical protein
MGEVVTSRSNFFIFLHIGGGALRPTSAKTFFGILAKLKKFTQNFQY